MLPEEEHIGSRRPNARPPSYGHTTLVRVLGSSGQEVLTRVEAAWSVVASWGRWCDENLGDWCSVEECLAALPEWLRLAIKDVPAFEIENWLSDLHDRNWTWWSGAVHGDVIKIDLNAETLPASWWMLKFVVNKAGTEILYDGDWIDSAHAREIASRR